MIPLGLKVVYTLFVFSLVPIYWRQYGPVNFLWFSDIALLALVPALWLENALLFSMMAVSVVFFELLWNIDFFFRLVTGKSFIGLSAYMFNAKISLFIRGLSGFHIVLPLLLLWMLHRLGYDPRAFLWQTIIALAVLPLSKQRTGERELGLWLWTKSTTDFARAVVCDSSNAAVSAGCLSAVTHSIHQDFSCRRIVSAIEQTPLRHWR